MGKSADIHTVIYILTMTLSTAVNED